VSYITEIKIISPLCKLDFIYNRFEPKLIRSTTFYCRPPVINFVETHSVVP